MKFAVFCFLMFSMALLPLAQGENIPVSISQNGSYILVTNSLHTGLVLVNTNSGEHIVITESLGAGYFASFSPDNRFVCFKAFQVTETGLLQAPMLFDIAAQSSFPLWSWEPQTGTPTIAPDGKIAFTVGSDLIILNPAFDQTATFNLGHHVNLLAFSPDGRKIAFNDPDQQIVILNLTNGQQEVITDGQKAWWGPEFSPDGNKVLATSVDGEIICADRATGQITSLGMGESPN